METSQDIVSCYPVNHMSLDLVWWRNSCSMGWRSDYEGHWSKEASKEFKILFIGFVYNATWKAMRKKASSNCFVSQHFFTWGWDQKSIDFDLQWEEESDFLNAVAIFFHLRMRPKVYRFWSAMRRRIRFFCMLWQAGQKIRSNRRKQIFVIFNNCQGMLQNVDEIIGRPFPVNEVFNRRLISFEVDLILQPFFYRLLSNCEA